MTRILVADDDRDARDLFAELLRFDGHDVVLARDGIEAERLVRERLPEIALIDIFMPRLDGLELIRRMRAQQPAVRIIAISAGWRRTSSSDAPDVLDDALQLGAHATLRKPVKPGELTELVKQLSSTPSGQAAD